jgi:DNA-binding transcriptional regulator YiaG
MTPDELKAARAALGLMQHQLAPLIGVSWRTLQAWEQGRSNSIPEPAAILLRALLEQGKS